MTVTTKERVPLFIWFGAALLAAATVLSLVSPLIGVWEFWRAITPWFSNGGALLALMMCLSALLFWGWYRSPRTRSNWAALGIILIGLGMLLGPLIDCVFTGGPQ